MDSLLTSAAHSLAAGNPLGALKRIALREDAPALAMRGVAMAQLGDYERARQLLRRAARRFGARERLAQARCQVAEAEVALAARDLTGPARALEVAAQTLAAHGDTRNAVHARLVAARRHLLVGDITAAEQMLASLGQAVSTTSPPLLARAELTRAEIALRRVRTKDAAAALDRAHAAARAAGIPALEAEIERARRAFSAPAARLIRAEEVRVLRLEEVETLFDSGDLIVDGCRRVVRDSRHSVMLAGRPVLFEIVRALAEAWPADVPRDALIARTFATRTANASHRARLRVEISRLRSVLRPLARLDATPRGFVLVPHKARNALVLAPPIDGPVGTILALLEDGEAWSTSALASALGSSQRTVQRTLRPLVEVAAVRAVGRGRSQRWLASALTGFATTLLLPHSLQSG